MTDDTAPTTTEATSTSSPSQPGDNDAEQEEVESTDVEGSGLSSMMRAIKHELEGEDMEVTVGDGGETLIAKQYDETYTIHTDGSVEGGGILDGAIEDRVEKIMAQDGGTVEPPTETDESEAEEQDDARKVASEPSTESETDTVGDEETGTEVVDTDESESEEDQESESLPDGSVGLFEASIEAGALQDAIDPVHAIVDECRFHLCDDGIVIRAVDPANVAMVDESIAADAFKSYETDQGEIGLILQRMLDIISLADDNETLIQLTLDPEVRKLEMQVGTLEYTLALIDPDSIRMEPDIPELDLPAEISVDSSEFKRGIRAGDMVSDHLQYIVDPHDEVFITAADGDTDDVNLELDGDDLEDAQWGAADSLFSMDYLKDLKKSIPRERTLLMRMGEEFPLKISFTMENEAIDVTYMLAPRISSD